MVLKKILSCVIIVALFLFQFECAFAYEIQDSSHESTINGMINQIYMTKETFEELVGEADEIEAEVITSNNDLYWWPVGSVETTEVNGKLFATGTPETVSVSSDFGTRTDPATGTQKVHRGTDIAGGRNGETNIIAAKSGTVVYPESLEGNDIGDGIYSAGYGNYVIIQHSDGNYTLYGHLAANSILVKAGDHVEQGQVIGKMGSSGYSTGTHLHFEIRIGENSNSAAVKTVGTYIFPDNPRPMSTSTSGSGGSGTKSDLINFIDVMEGGEATKTANNTYVIECIGDGAHTVGNGVTFEYNQDKFQKYGIDTSQYGCGDELPVDVIDQIRAEIIEDTRESVESYLASNGISLKDYQVDALTSLKYQRGNLNGFAENYKKYGETQGLWDNWFSWVGTSDRFPGTYTRREVEWELFTTGVYNPHY